MCYGTYYLNTSKTCTLCSLENCRKCQDNRSSTSRKNIEDSPLLSIPATVTKVQANSNEIYYSLSNKCCWTGETAHKTYCKEEYSVGEYLGCTRTVCNAYAAQEICQNFNYAGLKWRLPTHAELNALGENYSIGLENNGLQLCDTEYMKDLSTYFPNGTCKGSCDNKCYLCILWGEIYATGYARAATLYAGVYSRGNSHAYNSLSVRCVADME